MKVSTLGGSRTGRVDVVPEDATVYTELGVGGFQPPNVRSA